MPSVIQIVGRPQIDNYDCLLRVALGEPYKTYYVTCDFSVEMKDLRVTCVHMLQGYFLLRFVDEVEAPVPG